MSHKIYKTAQGKALDMGALIAKNEKTRAVGNMKVNARGDTIDSTGKIIVPATSKVAEQYGKTVGTRSAQVRSNPAPIRESAPSPRSKPQQQQQPQKTVDELDLDSSLDDDLEVEKIKASEGKK